MSLPDEDLYGRPRAPGTVHAGADARARSRRREALRRRRRRRRLGGAVIVLALAALGGALAVLLGGGGSSTPAGGALARGATAAALAARGGGGRTGRAAAGRTEATAATARVGAPGTTAPPVHRAQHRPAPSPGSLPQTDAMPSAHTAQFGSLMAALWAGVVADSVRPALPAFFPEGAFVQLKAVGAPEADWQGLVHDYDLDIHAAHALLGSDAASARLLAVHVPAEYAHWVPPGVCVNRDGYYELPNARVVYRAGGRVRSFGIASMISWRGVWYVVHLGAILREGDSGEVDEAAEGPGDSAYSGTC